MRAIRESNGQRGALDGVDQSIGLRLIRRDRCAVLLNFVMLAVTVATLQAIRSKQGAQSNVLIDSTPSQLSTLSARELRETFLYHLHIDKTGGSTLKKQHETLLPSFKSCNSRLRVLSYGKSENLVKIYEELSRDRNEVVCTVFSYEGDWNLSQSFLSSINASRSYHVITFLRSPVMQYLSRAAHDVSAGRYSSILDFYDEKRAYLNHQTHLIGGSNTATPDQALDNLKTMFMFGITEHYTLSLCVLYFQLYYKHTPDVFLKRCACTATKLKSENVRDTALSLPYMLLSAVHMNQYKDNLLYLYAEYIFMQRVTAIERITGRNLTCLFGK